MLHLLYIIAIIAEAMSATLVAGKREMDWVGVFILAWVTALGGGTVRNILFNHYPMSWVEHPEYLLITAGAAVLTGMLARYMKKLKSFFLVLDAVGLIVFTIIGCRVAQDIQLPFFITVLSGVITGCAGGVLRDVLCNEIPLLFHKEIYASAAFATGLLYLLLEKAGMAVHVTTLLAGAAGLAFRLLAIRFGWQMPKFIYHDDWH